MNVDPDRGGESLMDANEARERVCEIAKALAVLGVDSTTLARRVVEDGAKQLQWVDVLRECGEAMKSFVGGRYDAAQTIR